MKIKYSFVDGEGNHCDPYKRFGSTNGITQFHVNMWGCKIDHVQDEMEIILQISDEMKDIPTNKCTGPCQDYCSGNWCK